MEQTNNGHGYIYARYHPSYDVHDACKIGKTTNIPERDTQYATGEIKRGYFEAVFEVPFRILECIERLLQYEFRELHIQYDAGTEFYNKNIIPLIEPYLVVLGIAYRKLTKTEISHLTRCQRVKNTLSNINKTSLIQQLLSSQKQVVVSYTPTNEQSLIIETSVAYFQDNTKGVLVIPCGFGKTLLSLWISQRLHSNTILIGVPNTLLLTQWKHIVCGLFPHVPCLIVSSGVEIQDIVHFFIRHSTSCIIITTYASSHKVHAAVQTTSFQFHMKINDEVHHLTSSNMQQANTTTTYVQMLRIPSIFQLSLTATLKQLEGTSDNIISNDDVDYFGNIIDRKTLLWAIHKHIICDYVIQTIVTNEESFDQQFMTFHMTEENDKRLLISAFAALKSISDGHSHHLLVYCNNKDSATTFVRYVKMLLDNDYFTIPDAYYSHYCSDMTSTKQKEIIHCFETSTYGIISCVYCLGEGWDFPLLDGVVFAENMTSTIRIVQSALRASRKNKYEPNKITKIILPVLNRNDWLENNEHSDLKKVREVIYQLGLEDETISQKIKVYTTEITKQVPSTQQKETTNIGDSREDYDHELIHQWILKTMKRTALSTTFEKARNIIASHTIKSKEDYYKLCDKDHRLSKEPEIVFQGQFTNWIDYLSIQYIYYDLETCKRKVSEYIKSNPELKKYYMNLAMLSYELCQLDALFPPHGLWVEYYGVHQLQDIILMTINKKKTGVIL